MHTILSCSPWGTILPDYSTAWIMENHPCRGTWSIFLGTTRIHLSPNVLNPPIESFLEPFSSSSCNRAIWNLNRIWVGRTLIIPLLLKSICPQIVTYIKRTSIGNTDSGTNVVLTRRIQLASIVIDTLRDSKRSISSRKQLRMPLCWKYRFPHVQPNPIVVQKSAFGAHCRVLPSRVRCLTKSAFSFHPS